MKKIIGKLAYDSIYLIMNYVVNNIPIWTLRKVLYKLFGMKIGKNSRIHMKTIIINPWNIKIGENTIINEFCFIDGRGGLEIGNNVSISVYSSVLTASHETHSNEFKYKKSKVVIEDNVWIGIRVVILEGTVISEGAVLGAGSVIKKYAEPYGIYVGIPAKKISVRNIDKKYKLETLTFFR